MLFKEEADDARWIGRPSLSEEARSTAGRWMEAVDEEAAEGVLDSFTDDKEAEEFPLADSVLSVESKEDTEDDTEEVCWVGVSWEEGWEEAAASAGCFWSVPFKEWWDGEQEEAAGGDAGDVEELASAVGEDGGEV